jgi:hypothetical protein
LDIEDGIDEEAGPFDDQDDVFFAVPDEFEDVMDDDAGRHLG